MDDNALYTLKKILFESLPPINFKGVLHFNLKLACSVGYLKIINTLKKWW